MKEHEDDHEDRTCDMCSGSGNCQECQGTDIKWDGDCEACFGSGDCPLCNGLGEIED